MKAEIGVISHKGIHLFILNNCVALTDNNGTQYYFISCGVPSSAGLDLEENNGTKYYHISALDYILWGQPTKMTQPSANNGSVSYFLQCSAANDVGLNLQANNGTKFWYNSSFNCIKWCNP